MIRLLHQLGLKFRKKWKKKPMKKGFKLIKGSKYILTSSRERLKERDEIAKNWKDDDAKEHLFNGVQKKQPKGGREERYQELLYLNEDLFGSVQINVGSTILYSI